jgi:hypothetical protein
MNIYSNNRVYYISNQKLIWIGHSTSWTLRKT